MSEKKDMPLDPRAARNRMPPGAEAVHVTLTSKQKPESGKPKTRAQAVAWARRLAKRKLKHRYGAGHHPSAAPAEAPVPSSAPAEAPTISALAEALFADDPALQASFAANAEKRDLALALRALRRWAGLSQIDLSERAGIPQSHVSKIEAATGPMPTADTLHRYAAACRARVRISFVPIDGVADPHAGDAGIAAALI